MIDGDDNCPTIPNADQTDADDAGVGGACDDDSDDDGITDGCDGCDATPTAMPVLTNGCSVDQECPCNAAWKNHGAYVSCVARATNSLVAAGRITHAQKDAIQNAAGCSRCGSR